MIWTHGQEELYKFLAYLNDCHATIKFTMEASEEKINFLDTTLHKSEDGTLWTDLYSKPADSHNYLHYKSAHPSHCKKSLPYSQMLRIKRICTKHEDYLYHILVLCCHFLNRGYPLDTLIEALIKALKVSRQDLMEKLWPAGSFRRDFPGQTIILDHYFYTGIPRIRYCSHCSIQLCIPGH